MVFHGEIHQFPGDLSGETPHFSGNATKLQAFYLQSLGEWYIYIYLAVTTIQNTNRIVKTKYKIVPHIATCLMAFWQKMLLRRRQ